MALPSTGLSVWFSIRIQLHIWKMKKLLLEINKTKMLVITMEINANMLLNTSTSQTFLNTIAFS